MPRSPAATTPEAAWPCYCQASDVTLWSLLAEVSQPLSPTQSITSSAFFAVSSSYHTLQSVRQSAEAELAQQPLPRFMQDTDSSAQRISRRSASFKVQGHGCLALSIDFLF